MNSAHGWQSPSEIAGTTSTVALVLTTAGSPFATDTYLAALPAMQHELHTSPGLMQATLSTFVVGFAVGQLLTGPVSDNHGRRPFTIWGAGLFAISSAACALAPSIWVLLMARVLAGLGGGACVVAGRAMVTDRWSGTDAAKRLATLFSFLLLGPIIAPVAGGLVLPVLGWRRIFICLAALGLFMTVAALTGLPETLPHSSPAGATPESRRQLRRFGDLLAKPDVRRLLLANSLGSGAIFVYLGGSTIVYQIDFGAAPATFSILFGASAGTTALTRVPATRHSNHSATTPFDRRRGVRHVRDTAHGPCRSSGRTASPHGRRRNNRGTGRQRLYRSRGHDPTPASRPPRSSPGHRPGQRDRLPQRSDRSTTGRASRKAATHHHGRFIVQLLVLATPRHRAGLSPGASFR